MKNYANLRGCYPPRPNTLSYASQNSVIVFLFLQIISKFLTTLSPRRLSSKLWPIFSPLFKNIDTGFFLQIKVDNIHRAIICFAYSCFPSIQF